MHDVSTLLDVTSYGKIISMNSINRNPILLKIFVLENKTKHIHKKCTLNFERCYYVYTILLQYFLFKWHYKRRIKSFWLAIWPWHCFITQSIAYAEPNWRHTSARGTRQPLVSVHMSIICLRWCVFVKWTHEHYLTYRYINCLRGTFGRHTCILFKQIHETNCCWIILHFFALCSFLMFFFL